MYRRTATMMFYKCTEEPQFPTFDTDWEVHPQQAKLHKVFVILCIFIENE